MFYFKNKIFEKFFSWKLIIFKSNKSKEWEKQVERQKEEQERMSKKREEADDDMVRARDDVNDAVCSFSDNSGQDNGSSYSSGD
jgi:hypothetical protein